MRNRGWGVQWGFGKLRRPFVSAGRRASALAAITALFVVSSFAVALADPATGQSISINGGAASTNSLNATVTVAVVHCPPGGDLTALEVAFRNSPSDPWTIVHAQDTVWPGGDADGCTSGSPTSPTTDFSWTLAGGGDGTRTVFAQFKHATDEVFAQDSITFEAPPSDTTPPVITADVSGTLGNNGWYVSDVTVSWTVVDNESAISSTTGCGPTTISTDTEGTTMTCSATSAGGTSSDSVTIKRDATAPTINGSAAPPANGAGWNNTDVTVSFTCGDNLSGVASCGPDQTLSNEGAGQSATGNAFDIAGNSASATVSGINIDKTAPTLNPTVSPNPVLLNGSATASAGATDSLSGVASSSCGSVDTSTVGPKSVICSATDNAGNSNSAAANYSVAFKFVGFTSPVDNPNVLNRAKAGQAIPFKWRLLDANDQPVTSLSGVGATVESLSCALGTTADAVEEYATGSSGLQNLGNGYYQWNWKTPTSYANSCKTFRLDLGEDSPRTALFQFIK
jgi:hypothetical protein